MENYYKNYLDNLSTKDLWLRLSAIDNAELDEALSDGLLPFEAVPRIIEEAQYIEHLLGVANTDYAYANNWTQLLADYDSAKKAGRRSVY